MSWRRLFTHIIKSDLIVLVMFSPVIFLYFLPNLFSFDTTNGLELENFSIIFPMAGLFLISASILGFVSYFINEKRKKRLILVSLLLYYIDALIVSVLIVFLAEEYGPTISNGIADAFYLSLAGAILFLPLIFPLVFLAVMLYEKWTSADL